MIDVNDGYSSEDNEQFLVNLPVDVDYKISRKDEIFQKLDEYIKIIKNVGDNFKLWKVQIFFYLNFEHGDLGVPTISEKTSIYIIRSKTNQKSLSKQVNEIQRRFGSHRLYKINQTCQNVLKNIKIFFYYNEIGPKYSTNLIVNCQKNCPGTGCSVMYQKYATDYLQYLSIRIFCQIRPKI